MIKCIMYLNLIGLENGGIVSAMMLLPRMGASPQTPWLRGAARHYAVHQVEPFITLMATKNKREWRYLEFSSGGWLSIP